MIRIFLAVCLCFSFVQAQETTSSPSIDKTPEVTGSIETLSATKELKKNEFLFDTTYAGLNGSMDESYADTSVGIGFGYNRALTQFLQVGGKIRYEYSTYSTASSKEKNENAALAVGVGPTFNLGTSKGIENAYFLGLYVEQMGAGYSSYNGMVYTFTYGATAGKRFQIFENISFTPHVYGRFSQTSYEKTSEADSSRFYYGIQLLSASVLW